MSNDDDDGFTLVELLIAVPIMVMLLAVVSFAFVVGLQTSDEGNKRLVTSQAGGFTSNYFVKDVQGARDVAIDAATYCPGPNPVVSLNMVDVNGATGGVTYGYQTVGMENQLVRHSCGFIARESLVVARDLVSKPTAVCLNGCRGVRMDVAGAAEPNGSFNGVFSISATRRVS